MKTDDMKSGPPGPPACESVNELGRLLAFDAGAAALLGEGRDPRAGVRKLLEKGHESEAVKALAHLLPSRRSVWWAVLSAWHGLNGKPTPAQDQALASAVRWVMDPSESNRNDAEEAARVACADNAAGCCANAASLSGALSPARGEFLGREPFTAAAMVAHAINFAVSERQASGLSASRLQLVELGIELFDKDVPS